MNTFLTRTNARSTASFFFDADPDTLNRFSLGSLKSELVRKLSSEFVDLDGVLINQAVNEAQSLAALTVVPHLVLPVLAEEKVLALRKWSARQRVLLQRRALAFAA
jgi:hypothetical protein